MRRIYTTVTVAVVLLVHFLFLPFALSNVGAAECNKDTSFTNLSKEDLQSVMSECEKKRDQLKNQASNLSSQIQFMDTQIYLATLRIQTTEQKIKDTQNEIEVLSERIDGLDESLNYLSKLFAERIVQGYKMQSVSLFNMFFDSANASDFINKIKYQHTTQENNQKLLLQVQESKLNFEEQKKTREKKKVDLDDLKASLASQQNELRNQQGAKKNLLTETKNDESTYQKLVAAAQAQINAFTNFTSSQGGDSLLGNQTVCDDWGCYYNQRDSQWGGNALNHTGYTLASAGCLVTSMAMVYTHFGHKSVTPQTINSIPSNFASYYPAWLNFTIIADGTTSTRIGAAIDSELSAGRPVIVGISYDGGPAPDHFLVLISGSSGNYQMNDPYTPNGHNIPFTSRYTVNSIRTVQKVSM